MSTNLSDAACTRDCQSELETSTWSRPASSTMLTHPMGANNLHAKKEPDAQSLKHLHLGGESVISMRNFSIIRGKSDILRKRPTNVEKGKGISRCKSSVSKATSTASTPVDFPHKEPFSPSDKPTFPGEISEHSFLSRDPPEASAKFSFWSHACGVTSSRQPVSSKKDSGKIRKSRIPQLSKRFALLNPKKKAKIKSSNTDKKVQDSSALSEPLSSMMLISPKVNLESDQGSGIKQQKEDNTKDKALLIDKTAQNCICTHRSPHEVSSSKYSMLYSDMSNFKWSPQNPRTCSKTSLISTKNHNSSPSDVDGLLCYTREHNISPDEYETISLSSSMAKILQGGNTAESQKSFSAGRREPDMAAAILSRRVFCENKNKKDRLDSHALSDKDESTCDHNANTKRKGAHSVPPHMAILDTTVRLRELLKQRRSTSSPNKNRGQHLELDEDQDVYQKTNVIRRRSGEYRPESPTRSKDGIRLSPYRQHRQKTGNEGNLKNMKWRSTNSIARSGSISWDKKSVLQQQQTESHMKQNSPALQKLNETILRPAKSRRRHDSRNRICGSRRQPVMGDELSDSDLMLKTPICRGFKQNIAQRSLDQPKSTHAGIKGRSRIICRKIHGTTVSVSADNVSADESDNGIPNLIPNEEKSFALMAWPSVCLSPKPGYSAESVNSSVCFSDHKVDRLRHSHFHKARNVDKASNLSEAFDKLFSSNEKSGYQDKVMSIKQWLETTSFSKLSFQGSDCASKEDLVSNMVSFEAERSSISEETQLYRDSSQPSPTDGSRHVFEKPTAIHSNCGWLSGRERSHSRSPKVSSRTVKNAEQAAQSQPVPSRWPNMEDRVCPQSAVRKLSRSDNQISTAATEKGSPKAMAALTAAGHKLHTRKQSKNSPDLKQHFSCSSQQTLFVRCLLSLCVLIVTFELVAVLFLWHINVLPAWMIAAQIYFNTPSYQDDHLQDDQVNDSLKKNEL